MKKAFILLLTGIVLTGCGKTDAVKTDAVAQTPAGKPDVESAKRCITEFLAQCGMQDVTITQVADTGVPSGAKTASESWGYTFTAEYKNVFGEVQRSENWVAVVSQEDGAAKVRSCWDEGKKMVGGHQGHVDTPKAELLPISSPN